MQLFVFLGTPAAKNGSWEPSANEKPAVSGCLLHCCSGTFSSIANYLEKIETVATKTGFFRDYRMITEGVTRLMFEASSGLVAKTQI